MDVAVLGVYAGLFLTLYFEVFLLISYLEKRPAEKNAALPARFPSITMVVPCFNEAKTLAQTVRSLLALEYPKDKVEVLIVDDGSTDATRGVGEALAAQYPQVTFMHKENGGKYTALNLGIEYSKAELVGCLDADSFVAPDALLEVAKKLESDKTIMALTPAMKVYRARNMLEMMQAVEYTIGIFYKKMFDNLAAVNVLPGPFSIYKREVFKKIGLFRHAHNTEDMEMAFRMHAHGLKITNAHTAHVHTTVPSTFRALLKQRTRWTQGFLQNSRDYKYMYFNPRFGNFGTLVLPFALAAFAAGIYVAGYTLYQVLSIGWIKVSAFFATGVPLRLPQPHLAWQYLNTSMMTFLIVTALGMTLVAIFLGTRISKERLGVSSFVSYFVLYGFVAPLWLVRAAWGVLRAQESTWR